MKHHITLDEDVTAVLKRSVITATSLALPNEQLERSLYMKVDKVLKAAGGKWNGKAKAHLFPNDPREALGLAIETGGILNAKSAKQQFFTPPLLASELARRALIIPGMRVLEPSAGRGALAQEARVLGGIVICVESDPVLHAELIHAGFPSICQDFLTYIAIGSGPFDRVLMNPPFEGGQDIDHIEHAFTLLKDGGRLVSVASGGLSFRSDRKTVAFRALVKAHHGSINPLPAGSFSESGTDVHTVVVEMVK